MNAPTKFKSHRFADLSQRAAHYAEALPEFKAVIEAMVDFDTDTGMEGTAHENAFSAFCSIQEALEKVGEQINAQHDRYNRRARHQEASE